MAQRTQQTAQRMAQTLADQLPILLRGAMHGGRHGLGELIALSDEVVEALESPTTTTPDSLAQFLSHRDMDLLRRGETIDAIVGTESAETLRRQAEDATSQASMALHQPVLPQAVATPNGPVHLPDLVRALTIEAGLLADRLGTALDPPGNAQAVRACAMVLGERFPGHTIEVRVPPSAAVQLGSPSGGPTHHRGTPPNVVETDGQTFWQLCTGTTGWTQAREAHRLRVSGVHASEVAEMIPLLRRR